MIFRRLLAVVGTLLLSAGLASAGKDDGPKISVTEFDFEPKDLFYFEDTQTILFRDPSHRAVYRSTDAGKEWKTVDGPNGHIKGAASMIVPHPYDNRTAYILSRGQKTHWVTDDAAESWREFRIEEEVDLPLLVFHGRDPKKVILQDACTGILCEPMSYYTNDGFKSNHKFLTNAWQCMWAVSTPKFGDGLDLGKNIEDRILCIVPGLGSFRDSENRLIYSDNYFKGGKSQEVPLNNGRAVSGVVSTVAVTKYILAAAKSARTNELALYVSDDATRWHRAVFYGHKLVEKSYTVLDSTDYSIQVSVSNSLNPFNPMGNIFTSNSNGTYFTRNVEHVNSNELGYVDFEKVSGIQGIMLVNTVENWADVEAGMGGEKKIVSQISYDDGRTFEPVKVKGTSKRLHLHSVTQMSNIGKVFSSPAPGLIMGIGNTGDYLKEYSDGDLYVSDDGGRTWWKALAEAHKYEFGDQGAVLVAIYDEGRTNKLSYSVNHGKDWKEAELPEKVKATMLTTTPDSTSLKFLLVGKAKKPNGDKVQVMSIDFSDMHERHCSDKDFEKWPARLDKNGEPSCIMGHKQFYRRRKPNADCFVNEEFKDPMPEFEPCTCTEADFECDFNFVRSEDGKECIPAASLKVPSGQCKKDDDKYMGPSGYRLIPGNTCDRKGGRELDKEVERSCKETTGRPSNTDIKATKQFFSTDRLPNYFYLERGASSSGRDETIVMHTDQEEVWITHDHGQTWERLLEERDIVRVVPHRYFNDVVYFLTGTEVGYWTTDRGQTVHKFKSPVPFTHEKRLLPMSFHPKHQDWVLWTGAADDCAGGSVCSNAYWSTNRGADWKLLNRYVKRCEFKSGEQGITPDTLVFCEQYENENPATGHLQLLSSTDWFGEKKVHFENILDFATMSEFLIVAARANDTLKVDTSIDGLSFAEAKFPHNFQVHYQTAYTVLDSSTHAVMLHVTVNNEAGREYGSILKSNSNGTSYVVSLNGVNRDRKGYVDFEKMLSIEGVALANVVGNLEDVEKKKSKKQLKTVITHNDGAEWGYLQPPEKDSEGRDWPCNPKKGFPEKCALHLHAYTEDKDFRDTYSSPSAIGLLIGLGNVGEYLGLRSEANTFLSRDGGITWREIRKGTYAWEFGDQGSIIALVPEGKATKTMLYSLDEGETWREFQFSDVDMQIDDISTVPSDNSRNFVLWGKEVGSGAKGGYATVNVDFSGLKERSQKCKFNEDDPTADDYYLWEPKHPLQSDNCLFGHVSQYHRKKTDSQCYNDEEIQHLSHVKKNCECTRRDYECAYNYERQIGGSCALVPGLSPPDPVRVCSDDKDAIEWYEPTGYRKVPLSTCEGGLQLDKLVSHPCPNRKEEYRKKHPGISATGLFFAITIPVIVAFGVGYYAYQKWDGKFGRIRLGESASGGSRAVFDSDAPVVKGAIAVVSAVVAVVSAVPLLFSSLWRSLRSRFSGGSQRPYYSRGAFAARRGDYMGVASDEDELLGDDELEDDEPEA